MRRCPAKIAILAYLFLAFINMRAGAQAQWPVHPWESKPALPLVEMEEPPLQAMSTPNVPVFGQRDGRWSGIHLGGSGWTMYDSGCAVTSVAMVFKYFGGDVDPGALCNWLNGNGGLDGGGNINWARAADSQGGRSWWIERKDWNYVLGSGELDYLRTQVDRGYPPIVEVRLSGSRHFVVITGYSGGDFYINDPWYADSAVLNSRYGNPADAIWGCRLYGGNVGSPANARWTSTPPANKWFRSNERLSYHIDGSDPITDVHETIRTDAGETRHDAHYSGIRDGYLDLSYAGRCGWYHYTVVATNQLGSGSVDIAEGWDNESPTVTIDAARNGTPGAQPSVWYTGDWMLFFTCHDPHSGNKRHRLKRGDDPWTGWANATGNAVEGGGQLNEGRHTWLVEAEDQAWNGSSQDGNGLGNWISLGPFLLDNGAPSISTGGAQPGRWYGGGETVTWSISDSLSGPRGAHWWRTGGQQTYVPGATGTLPLDVEGNYHVYLRGYDNATNGGTASGNSQELDLGEFWVDKTAPSTPAGLTAQPQNSTAVRLTWNASTDNLAGVDHYVVRRDGAPLPTTTGLACDDAGLTPGRTYAYTVSAVDTVGNESQPCDPMSVTVGASALKFVVQPRDTVAGEAITSWVKVALVDANGNTVTSDTRAVTLSLQPNVPLGGTPSSQAVAGVATFDDLHVDRASGTLYRLTATADGLTGATSQPFSVRAGAAHHLEWQVWPRSATAGTAIAPAVRIVARDSCGNLVAKAADTVTVALGSGAGGGTLSGTLTRPLNNGVAIFDDLSIDKPGNEYTLVATSAKGLPGIPRESAAFNIRLGPPAQLAFRGHPSDTVVGRAIAPAVSVEMRDAGGNFLDRATNSVTVALGNNPRGGTLRGTLTVAAVKGVATFNDLWLDVATNAPYSLVASSPGLQDSPPSRGFVTQAAEPVALLFSTLPRNGTWGAVLNTLPLHGVDVLVKDRFGNTVHSPDHAVSIALASSPAGGTLTGTRTVTSVYGRATFSDLRIDKVGEGYTLRATSGQLTPATSQPFNITAGPPAKLAFKLAPRTTAAGTPIAPPVQVEVQDAGGNPVPSARMPVTVALDTAHPGAILSGRTTATPNSGVATFAGLRINRASGRPYTLTAAAPGLPSATSTGFFITAGPAARLAFTVQPRNTRAGAVVTPAVKVTVQDACGNTVTRPAFAVAVHLGANPGGSALLGTRTVTTANGVATFVDLKLTKPADGYVLRAGAPGLLSVSSKAFSITSP